MYIVVMVRKNLFLKQSQVDILNKVNELSFSEHVRRAVDEYIDKIQIMRVSGSMSEKVGD